MDVGEEPMIDPAHEVILDGLRLMQSGRPAVHPGFTLTVRGQDTQWGNPQPVIVTLLSMLAAGSLVSRSPDANREPTLLVDVSCNVNDGDALAAGEAALMGVCNHPADLEWLPPQANAERAVFDVVDSSLEHVMDEVRELLLIRTYRIKLSALPYARDEALTTAAAVPYAAPVIIDTGSATTNWTVIFPTGATVTVVSGAVTSTYDPSINSSGLYGTKLRRAFPVAIDTSVNKYVAVDWKSSVPSYHGFIPNAIPFGNLAEVRRDPLTGGYVRSYYQLPASVNSMTEFTFDIIHPAQPAGSATLSIDQVQVMQALPVIGTGRQLLRTIQVGGSAPTQGTIDVTHASSGLGEAMVYTYESQGGYQPPLSPWRTLPAPGVDFTTDSSTLNGGFWALSTLVRWAVPVTALPDGEAVLVMRLHNTLTGTCTFDWSAFSEMAGGVLGMVSGQFSHTFAVANTPVTVVMPVPLNLPTVPMGPNGLVSLDVRRLAAAGPGASHLHEGWLFNTEGSLSIVGAGSRKRLSLEAPSLAEPLGAMWVGDNADKSDWYSVSAEATSRQHHTLKPGSNNIFTVTTTAVDAAVAASHYNRHHTHPKSA